MDNFSKPEVILKSGGYELHVFKIFEKLSFQQSTEETKVRKYSPLGRFGISLLTGIGGLEQIKPTGSLLVYSMGETPEDRSYMLRTGPYYFWSDSEHQFLNPGDYLLMVKEL